jgi:hypothetical protein
MTQRYRERVAGDYRNRLQQLVESLFLAPKQPDDAALGITLPTVSPIGEDTALVAAVAEYVAARQIAMYRDAADFEPRHVVEVQEDALRLIQARHGLPNR